MNQVVLARYGEIALKGANRGVFERALLRGVRRVLPAGAAVEHRRGRIVVEAPGPVGDTLERLGRVFGLVSFHPALRVPLELEAIVAAAVDQARAAGGGQSFKIEARRANKRFPVRSPQLAATAGAAVLQAGLGLRVDVHQPQLVIGIEVRDEAAYVFGAVTRGPGGLPVGTSGRGMLLLSGGIDSPVAGYLAARRGLDLAAVYFHAPPFTGEAARQKAIDLGRLLAGYTGRLRLWVAHFTDIQLAIRDGCPDAFGTIVARRMMLRLAEALARRERCGALITGDNLGQVASQTLESLAAVGEVAELPVLRPLLAWDKTETVALARRIGTYDVSVRPFDDCCAVFVPARPKTRPTREAARAAESALDVAGLTQAALERSERVELAPVTV